MFFGLLFMGLGLWAIRLLAVESRIVVEQQRFTYTSTCLWVFDCGNAQAEATDVRGVTMVGHEIHVQLADGAHRLELPASNGDEKVSMAREIQSALSQPGASFRHEEGSPLAALLLGLVCLGAGRVILSAIQWVTVIGDRDAGTMRVLRRLLFWSPWRERVFSLAEVEAVLVTPHTLRTGRHIVTSYSVRLRTRGRDSAGVGITFLPMFTEKAAGNLARILRAWLKSIKRPAQDAINRASASRAVPHPRSPYGFR